MTRFTIVKTPPSWSKNSKDCREFSKKPCSSGQDLEATTEQIIEPTLEPAMIRGKSLCSTRVLTTPT
ncbi:hypothetical protein F2Q70_00006738 [Brassica cretica]|uniref:Uncharacterized protein n=1 Tax=Brassica cretica TaxID=69181 RepID=A0A8S9J3J0_BRACR|nr:hypothetical protein F2Q70_00006738 [Brassica cretica]